MSRPYQPVFVSLGAFLLLALFFTALNAQTGKLLLGIPFGEPLHLKICPFNTDTAKAPCWVSKPFVAGSGHRLGSIHLPNANSRPDWAENVQFRVLLDRQDRVLEINVNTLTNTNRYEIADSISKRFGLPQEDQLRHAEISWARWKSLEGNVEMRCKDECWIDFRTPSAQAERETELRAREKSNAAKPKAP